MTIQERQNQGIELIASENYCSKDVRRAVGSILTNKYAEGYPGRRYYGGCEFVDEIERIAIKEACDLFECKFANVQPHSGSQANAAAYRALMPNGGKVLSLVLNDGGHLTHGSPVSFSSNFYTFIHYPLDKDGRLNYESIKEITLQEKPDVILSGYSAFPYEIDFKKITTSPTYNSYYDDKGHWRQVQTGYEAHQTVRIESRDIDKIEALTRDISELYDQNIMIENHNPEYYYTKLADLKLQMLAEASQDAKNRAETITKSAGAKLGDLKSANMGVFQITKPNSSEEDYTWGGAFNTSSKEKRASINMRLTYYVK